MRIRLLHVVLSALAVVANLAIPTSALADSQVSLQVTMDPAYPVVGQDTRLTALAKDRRGRPITKAQVVVTAWMDKSDNPGMPEMLDVGSSRLTPFRVPASPQRNAGEYAITSALPMSGRWRIQVWVSSSGASGKTELELAVISAPPPQQTSWTVIGIFMISVALMASTLINSHRLVGTAMMEHVKSRWYPVILQFPVFAVFAAILYFLIAGPRSAHDNLGSALVWIVWWPLLPVIFLLLGRFWCAVCPMSGLSDLVQRFAGRRKAVPPFLRRWGVWLVLFAFLSITWFDSIFRLVDSPSNTAYLLSAVIIGVVACGALFERRTWCRYLCFIGGMSSNYAMSSVLELRGEAKTCQDCRSFECVRGTDRIAGCPMFEFPRVMESNRHCNLCGNCVKSCPNNAVHLRLRFPAKELWRLQRRRWEEAIFAATLLGLVAIQTVVMLDVWEGFRAFLSSVGIEGYPAVFTFGFLGALALYLFILWLASAISARISGNRVSREVVRYAYALIPLGLAAHLAHNLNHLLGEALSVATAALALLAVPLNIHPSIISLSTIQILQYLVLAGGGTLAMLVATRLASSRNSDRSVQPEGQASPVGLVRRIAVVLPHALLIVGTTAVFIWMFSQEMVPRMQMSAEMHDDVTQAQIERAKASAREFVGRNIELSYVHLEEHGYRDIILKSGQDYYFVDAENYMVVSTFSERITTSSSYRISNEDARRIALNFALRHYPAFYKNNLQPEEGTEESSPFIGGHVFKWRQYIDGVPTPNAVKVGTDEMGRVAIYSARDVKVTVPTSPTVVREQALEIARQKVDYVPTRETIALDIGPELTGRQMLRWTVRLEGRGEASSRTVRNAEIIVDAITGEVTSIIEWS